MVSVAALQSSIRPSPVPSSDLGSVISEKVLKNPIVPVSPLICDEAAAAAGPEKRGPEQAEADESHPFNHWFLKTEQGQKTGSDRDTGG